MKFINQNILIISNEAWGDIWYSKHNWAFELSKKNQVYFINPPKKWKLGNLFDFHITSEKYSETLHIINYENILPYTRFQFLYALNEDLISKKIKLWFLKNNIRDYIFWTFDPYRFSNPKLLSPLFSIYFIADKYNIDRELVLIKNIDYCLTISPILTDHLAIKNPLVLSHGIAETEFTHDEEIDVKENFILYIGNIDYRLDYDFIKQLVTQFSEEHFLFIGKLNPPKNALFVELFIEKKYKNLIYHTPVHFKKLKNYISKAKICLAPMQIEVHGNNINHHKLLQYLAQGKPTISACFKDYENNSINYTYQNHSEGINLMKKLLGKKEQDTVIENRINFAKQFTYTNLIQKVETFLSINK